jgi:hypothetical protein
MSTELYSAMQQPLIFKIEILLKLSLLLGALKRRLKCFKLSSSNLG